MSWMLDSVKSHYNNGLSIYEEMVRNGMDASLMSLKLKELRNRFNKELGIRWHKRHHYVYQTKNLVNGKTYIGVHSTNFLNDGYIGSGSILKEAIKKYGRENFLCVPLCFFNTAEDAYEEERYLVDEDWVKSDDNYNIVLGGNLAHSGVDNGFFNKGVDRSLWIELHNKGVAKSEIAKMFDVTESLVRHFFRRRGIAGRSASTYIKKDLDREDVLSKYYETGSYRVTAKHFNVSDTAIKNCLGKEFVIKQLDIRKTHARNRRESTRRRMQCVDAKRIYIEYLKQYRRDEILERQKSGVTYEELASIYGVAKNTFTDIIGGEAVKPHVRAHQWIADNREEWLKKNYRERGHKGVFKAKAN